MNIFIYGDESGVFDQAHNDVFVFGGLVFLGKDGRDAQSRKYIAAERKIAGQYSSQSRQPELKASLLSNKHRSGLFRSTNGCIRYAFVIDQRRVLGRIFESKKDKQRYLDYVFKVGLKRVLGDLVEEGVLDPHEVGNIYVRFDEHTTATNGRYELGEAIEAEFKRGTYNQNYSVFHPPLFPEMGGCVELSYRNSETDALIRASDIIANRALYHALSGRLGDLEGSVRVVRFP